ncbi:hypothetical protein PGANDO_1622, partial [Porphyromonas gingivalis]
LFRRSQQCNLCLFGFLYQL